MYTIYDIQVSPELQGLLGGLTPHLVMQYSTTDYTVHKDIYRIICHATEHTVSSAFEKERCAALWRDMLRVRRSYSTCILPPHSLYERIHVTLSYMLASYISHTYIYRCSSTCLRTSCTLLQGQPLLHQWPKD